MSKAVIVIPARYGSARLPGKPLLDIVGKPCLLYTSPSPVTIWQTLLTRLLDQHYGLTLNDTPFADELSLIHILRWRCWNFEPDAGKQLNSYLASEGILRQ